MTDFLLELLSEEIPARMQDDARANLQRLFKAELAKAGLKADDIATYATPRRLALIAYGLPLETEAVSEETKGPKVSAPPQALEGFLRKTGLTQGQLIERDGVYFAVVEKSGRKTADVLSDAIPMIVRSFPWPKSMRWGAASRSTESLRWVRPLQGIVALLGNYVVSCEVDGIVSGRETMGHRFHHTGEITIGNAGDYETKLRAAHVILDQNEREIIIREGALKVAADAGLTLVQDPGLVTENAGLTEWPVPMLGRFDPAFLDVPEEVIQLTARVNQKYFICRDSGGKLANAFVCTANIEAHDGGVAIVAGNEKVLAARLSDAKFFWEQDKKIKLEDQASKLSQIVFHEKLGTVADKVERVAKLARWLVESGVVKSSSSLLGEGDRPQGGGGEIPPLNTPPSVASQLPPPRDKLGEDLANQAERAARLCKADLVTGMVGEFPELQGIMGGYYARAQGEDDAVADAIRDHYKPVGQGDDVPTAPVTVAVSLADKLDTLMCFFAIGEKPTGSKDPFALRRATLSAIRLILENGLRFSLDDTLETMAADVLFSANDRDVFLSEAVGAPLNEWGRLHLSRRFEDPDYLVEVSKDSWTRVTATEPTLTRERVAQALFGEIATGAAGLVWFFADRLKVQQREAGVRHDLIDAVFALGGEDDLVRLLARVKALQAFVGTDEGVNLLAGYKRAANILKQAGDFDSHALANAMTPVESALLSAVDHVELKAGTEVQTENFEAAMTTLATLRAPIDAFFEGVMVNDPDPDKRAFRIGLLTRFRDGVHKVADFSRIEG